MDFTLWLSSRTERNASTGCLEWTKGLHSGYAYARFGKHTKNVSRAVWEHHYGKIPEGCFICHKCDNRKCVEISHLFVGSPNDNIQDMIAKGRNNMRGKPKTSVIKQQEVKTLFVQRLDIAEICARTGVSRSTVYRILSGTL